MTDTATGGAAVGAFIQRTALFLETLAGWRRYAVAFGLGRALILTLPPLSVFPQKLVIFPAVLVLLRRDLT